MTKDIFKKVNFSLLTISMVSLGIFLWLSDNYKDNFILWCLVPLVVISYIFTCWFFFKEKKLFKDEPIDVSYICEVFSMSWKMDKSSILSFIFQELAFIFIIIFYNYGFLVIPFCFYTFTNFIETFVNKFDKKRIEKY